MTTPLSRREALKQELDATLTYVKQRQSGVPLQYQDVDGIYDEASQAAAVLAQRRHAVVNTINGLMKRVEEIDTTAIEEAKIANAQVALETLQNSAQELTEAVAKKQQEFDALNVQREATQRQVEEIRRKAQRPGRSSEEALTAWGRNIPVTDIYKKFH